MKNLNNNGKIYMYTNKINGKVYIGQTIQSLKDRAKRDGKGYKGNPRFENAIIEYGWENFEPTILVSGINTQEELNRLEIEYISKYNSTNEKYGYNVSIGADKDFGQNGERPIDQYDSNFNFVQHYQSISEASRKNLGFNLDAISHCANHRSKSAYGYIWCFSDEKLDKSYYKDLREEYIYKSVDQYSLDGKFIQTFDKIADACESLGKDRKDSSHIVLVCMRNEKTAYGYQWKYHDDKREMKPFVNKKYVSVSKYDENWNYIKTFKSLIDGARSCDGTNTTNIKQCCEGKREFAYGFRWKYAY